MHWPPSKKDITIGSICLMLIGSGLSIILGPITAWAAIALGSGILIGNYLPRNDSAARLGPQPRNLLFLRAGYRKYSQGHG